MSSKTLLCTAFALLLSGHAVSAAAQQASDAPPPPPSGGEAGPHRAGVPYGGPHGFGPEGPEQGVIGDLRGLEHLYRLAGHSKDLAAVYNEVLAKSQDPRVRNYVYQQLARLQAEPSNLDQAIGTLRKSLDENLSLDAKRHAEMEAMHAKWAQRQSADGSKNQ